MKTGPNKAEAKASQALDSNLKNLPGHYARRIHQLAVALYTQEVAKLNITPVQYSTLQVICNQPGIDQKTLASTVGSDTATIGGVIDRLEARGLVLRNVAPHDRRARLITPTKKGVETLEEVIPCMLESQRRFLAPLTPKERKEFMRLMKVLIDSNAELSNTPAKG
ncbi:MAG TPA: MarR family transcriptional regulator [Pusillimonas sp.]|uniref:MarR family winged helix-turn-helix transcriptional regulator n=1 Tax=Pusillimonas sp. TaxID=3040095 RepID=UPI002C6B4B6E|nr:MarR family transcriptional regulator [Pusillimonas sp.]HUH87760.1 MarR family transcriptional regulator [Pusillimonas sp.]